MEQSVVEMEYDTKKAPLGKITTEQVIFIPIGKRVNTSYGASAVLFIRILAVKFGTFFRVWLPPDPELSFRIRIHLCGATAVPVPAPEFKRVLS